MNVLFVIAAITFVFAVIDILTAIFFKIKRTAIRNISLATLGVLTVVFLTCGIFSEIGSNRNDLRLLYNAYSCLMDDNTEKAEENVKSVDSPHSDMIMLLSQCIQGNYPGAFISSDELISSGRLNEELYEQADKLYQLLRRKNGLEGADISDSEFYSQSKKITKACFDLLRLDENTSVEFLSGYSREKMLDDKNYYNADIDSLNKMLEKTPNDSELLKFTVQTYNVMNDFTSAEQYAMRLLENDRSAQNIVFYSEAAAQNMLNENYYSDEYDKNDSEISGLIEQAVLAEQEAYYYDYDDPEYEENMAKAEELRTKIYQIKVKRIINWLTAQTPLWGDDTGIIDLQLSRLYCAAGEEERAFDILLDLARRYESLNASESLKNALKKFLLVYTDSSASDSDIAEAMNALLQVDGLLTDSNLSRGYSDFLNRMLKYERVSIFISRVETENYPTVRTYLNVNGEKHGSEELANDFEIGDFSFNDNGFDIPVSQVQRITDENSKKVSIALVIDGSGSMDGTRIENAKKAVEKCIENMDPESQELSIVIYESSASIITPLTNDKDKLMQGAKQIEANGGTIISSGLYSGIESLQDAIGTKAIILMTDGEDGSPETMDGAILAAQQENITVFTVSTGGGEREYMENIAQKTGGTYMEAVTDKELIDVYSALQNYIVNNYCFEYTITDGVDANPRTLTIGLNDYNVKSSRAYAHSGMLLTKDGCYVSRSDTHNMAFFYAEPSSVSMHALNTGIPITISGTGFEDGAEVYVKGNKINSVGVVGNSFITFFLQGNYSPGELEITVKNPDGSSQTSSSLIYVSENEETQAMGKTVSLGNGNTIYADNIEKLDDYTISLSGNVVLNEFLYTDGKVTISSDMEPIRFNGGNISVSGGYISAMSPAYTYFSQGDENYGSIAFGGSKIQVLDYFYFYFSEYDFSYYYYDTTIELPGFGQIVANVVFDGSELTYTAEYNTLDELAENIDHAFNSIDLTDEGSDDMFGLVIGPTYVNDSYYYNYYDGGITVQSDNLTVTIKKDEAQVNGYGTVNGSLGMLNITDAAFKIDTSNVASMFSIDGNIELYPIQEVFDVDEYGTFSIASKAYYPDSITVDLGILEASGEGFSNYFYNNDIPDALDTDIKFSYNIGLKDEPYYKQLSTLFDDVDIQCDKIRFVYSDDYEQQGIILYNSSDPGKYVKITYDGIVIPINDIDELTLFGSELGGEITGTATISSWDISLDIKTDGHLDNTFYNIKYDGKSTMKVQLNRNAYLGEIIHVALTYGAQNLKYDSTILGGPVIGDGFNNYTED